MQKNPIVTLLAIVLFLLPFFWFKPGEMDLGGDSNRLYFYDPITYLKNTNLYVVSMIGKGNVLPTHYDIPHIVLIALLKFVFTSSTIVISILTGAKLAGGLIAIYLIICELHDKKKIYIPAILAGLFYIVSFGSFHMAIFWNRALNSHNQIFLNPLIFYFFLKYLLTHNYKYLWTVLLLSFVFATNFSLTSAPPFFAFYPLAFLFLFFYIKLFSKKQLPWRGILIGTVFFLGIHAFHILGQVINLFESGTYINSRVFNKTEIILGGVQYFIGVSGFGKASLSLLLPSEVKNLQWLSFVSPLVIITGFLASKEMRKKYLLIAIFFMLSLFLATANITNIGYEFYKRLFYIPGFSIFRNFYTQWLYVFIFFYALLFGLAVYSLAVKLKPYNAKLFYLTILILFLTIGMPLFLGHPITKAVIRGSNNIRSVLKMDSQYEETLQFIRLLPHDGKILVLPLTDFYYQVVQGEDGGAYEGPSTISHLAGKYSFVGYQDFGYRSDDPAPYAEDIMKYAREKNYERLLRLFTTLNIRYILHNSDPRVYEESFSPGPYGYMQTSLPRTQEEYKDFLRHFPLKVIHSNGPYIIYEIDKSVYNPIIFIPEGVYQSSRLSFDEDKTHAVFLEEDICEKEELIDLCQKEYLKPDADIGFNMINPTFYSVTVQLHKPADSLFLVMQHTFHKDWRLLNEQENITESVHVPVNGYANGWLITRKVASLKGEYKFFIKLDLQKYFWYGWLITSVFLFATAGLFVRSLLSDKARS